MTCKPSCIPCDASVGRAGSAAPARRAGFTLTELLLAVAAMALLAIAIAQVFALTSRTVQAGRRQSAVTTAAAAMERQLRNDLQSITREGFLVIRNQWSTIIVDPNAPSVYNDPPGPAPLGPNDPAPRPRRLDELLFFARGDFVSKREPVPGGPEVRSDAAMIYYGHGSGQVPGADLRDQSGFGGSGYSIPVSIGDGNPLSNTNREPVAPPHGTQVPFSPQRYAKDWVLTRREFLLRPSSASPFNGDFFGQIGFQPATNSITAPFFAFPGQAALSSGTVDLIAQGLSDVRTAVVNVPSLSSFFSGTAFNIPWLDPQRLTVPSRRPSPSVGFTFNSALTQMQRVMTGALPAPSDSYRRTRVERVAPNLLGWDWQNPNVPSSDFQRTDQLMLSSGAFLPRCTEFIVEWSFGLENKADEVRASAFSARLPGNQPAPARPARVNLAPANSVFWHGLPRQVRLGGNVISSTIPYAEYYTLDQPGNPYTNLTGNAFWQALRDQYYYSQPVRLRNGETRLVPHVVKPELIETLSTFGGPAVSPSVYYATFGYVDPTWAPETRLTRGNGQPFLAIDRNGNGRFDSDDGDLRAVELERDVNGNGQYDPEDGDRVVLNEPETIPWAWPTMIRVTFSLADDGAGTSPATEQTFQVIVELPREQGPKGN